MCINQIIEDRRRGYPMHIRVSIEEDEKFIRLRGAWIILRRRVDPDFSVCAEGHAREGIQCYFALRRVRMRDEPAFTWGLWHGGYGKRLHRYVCILERNGHLVRVQGIDLRNSALAWRPIHKERVHEAKIIFHFPASVPNVRIGQMSERQSRKARPLA